jgi:opacity protein-like surface antigen
MKITSHKENFISVYEIFNTQVEFILCVLLTTLFTLTCFFPQKTFASSINRGYAEISGEFGLTDLSTKNEILNVTPIETDTLHQTNNPLTGIFGFGIGYVFPLHSESKGINWFPYLKPTFNLRYFEQDITGQVYQFQDPEFYNYNYNISVSSTRFMLDLVLALFKYHRFSGYVLGGCGEAWNQISYDDQPLPGVSGGSLNLSKENNYKFVSEIGGGISYDMDKQLSFSLEYIYSNLRINETASTGTLNGSPTTISPIKIPITSQSVQFMLTWKML